MLPSEMLESAAEALRRFNRDGNGIDRCRAEVRAKAAFLMVDGLSQRDTAMKILDERDVDSRAFQRTRIMRCWDCQQARDEVIAELMSGTRSDDDERDACRGCGAVTSRGEAHLRSCENA